MADTVTLEAILDRMEELLEAVDSLPEADRRIVYELLDAVDHLHRVALYHVGQGLGPAELERLADVHPSVEWLFDAYAVRLDRLAAANQALADVRPYVESHGGNVEVLAVEGNDVRVGLSGACAGCTASAITLQEGVERALQTLPWFASMIVEEEAAPAHPPPGPTLLQIQPHPDSSMSRP